MHYPCRNICTPLGSSPRAWGNAGYRVVDRHGERFIPTCVGKCIPPGWPPGERSVHPHVRGEMIEKAIPLAPACGSSPRAWGNGTDLADQVPAFRFIPTCVGKCGPRKARVLSCPVHPHVRGEMGATSGSTPFWTGSSPRAWGNASMVRIASARRRFIPTCVGKWQSGRGPGCPSAVHPHVRGEMTSSRPRMSLISGSSPRAWGNATQLELTAGLRRFIPTCVGKWAPVKSPMR